MRQIVRQSRDYAPAKTGWCLYSDGLMEINDLVIRA